MNKKVILGIILIFFIVLSVIILMTLKNKETNENKEVLKTSNLTSTVLKISNNYVTMQDENNIIYTFFITEALNLEVGDVIQLEYKGELNTSKEIQDNEVVSYEVLEKVNSSSSVSTIAKKVDQDKITKLKQWLDEEDITSGINIDDDVKRSYPYNNLAANVIGFCGTDNQGLDGLESTWDSVLKGTSGKIVTSTNVSGQEIPDENKQEIPPQNGSDIVLSIDYYIQSIVEKYLKQAVIENNCEDILIEDS